MDPESMKKLMDLVVSGDYMGIDGAPEPFASSYTDARELEAAERAGDEEKLRKLDFAVPSMCAGCTGPCVDPQTKELKRLKCAGCKAVIYCSVACQTKDWNTSKAPRAPTHKELCKDNKEHMKRVPEFQAVLKQFPWARIEPDGSFSHDVLRARHGVLGSGLAFGYWSVPRGMQSHGASASNMQAMQNLLKLNPRDLLRQMQTRAPTKPYVYGEVLLGSEWPTDVEGWNMKDHEAYVPRLFFTDEVPPPERPRPGQIKDWMSWYAWRGLSLESPVALLMDFPLSVYHLLVDILKVVRPDNGPGKRQSLDVHYIGTEIELNYLPIFSELALLLPYTDITLTLFGESVYELVQTARKNHPGSLATQDIVWSYTAPKKTGQGSIKIKLYPDAKLWDRHVLVGIGSEPDAMVALDAGLMAYPTWQEPIQMSTVLNIPFAVTEYAEQSMDVCARNLPDMRAMFASSILGMSGMPPSYIANLRKYHPHPITINPFHRPGQRPVAPYRLPNYYNGFAMPVVLKD